MNREIILKVEDAIAGPLEKKTQTLSKVYHLFPTMPPFVQYRMTYFCEWGEHDVV